MPRFSLNDLLMAITLVAIGLSIEFTLFQWDGRALRGLPLGLKILFVFVAFGSGGAMIGAGVLAPFRKKIAGALFGFAVVGSFFVLMGLAFIT